MALVLEDVTRTVSGVVHVHSTRLTLERGSLNVLLGPTLSGKTSLLRLMAGLDRPDSGRLSMDGTDVTTTPVRKRRVAMVYQQFINYPTLSVFENIASPLRVAGLSRAGIEAKVQEAARLLRLTPYLARTPAELSGGQQQRTAIARALVKDAGLVLMDEPLANLDYKLREELREELPRIFAAASSIFVYATTEPAEALLLGGRTATLHEGRITQFGPAAGVFRRPHDLTTARIFSDPPLNTIAATRQADRLVLATGESLGADGLDVPQGPLTLALRAHDLRLAEAGQGIAAVVRVAEIAGSESYVHVRMGGAERATDWVAQVPGVRRLDPGEAVGLLLDPAKLFAFAPDGRLLAAPGGA